MSKTEYPILTGSFFTNFVWPEANAASDATRLRVSSGFLLKMDKDVIVRAFERFSFICSCGGREGVGRFEHLPLVPSQRFLISFETILIRSQDRNTIRGQPTREKLPNGELEQCTYLASDSPTFIPPYKVS